MTNTLEIVQTVNVLEVVGDDSTTLEVVGNGAVNFLSVVEVGPPGSPGPPGPISNLDTDGTLAANSDAKVSSQKAVKTYVDAVQTGIGVAVINGGAF